MTRRSMLESALAAAALAASPRLADAGQPVVRNATLEQAVADTERAFARSLADRDLAAFTRLLAAEAVFFGSDTISRGREAVAAAWKRFFDAPAAPFSWRPERVLVLDSGALGLSTGPVFDPAGKRIGTFNSVWRREADGAWRIVFDIGCPPCQCP